MVERDIPIYNREDYCNQHGSENPVRLLWRKICSRMQRGVMFAVMRRWFAKWMGVRFVHRPGASKPFLAIEIYLDDTFPELITIESNVAIAMRCMILCHDDTSRKVAGVVLEEGCYLGAGTILLPGVRIGKGSILSAGSVVSRNVPPGEIWGGNPARRLGYTRFHKTIPSESDG